MAEDVKCEHWTSWKFFVFINGEGPYGFSRVSDFDTLGKVGSTVRFERIFDVEPDEGECGNCKFKKIAERGERFEVDVVIPSRSGDDVVVFRFYDCVLESSGICSLCASGTELIWRGKEEGGVVVQYADLVPKSVKMNPECSVEKYRGICAK